MSETVSYEAKLKSFYGTGRRKHSVARVRLYPGSGNVTINGRTIDDYFGLDTLKLIVRQPLALTETDAQFDIVCTVAGGGVPVRLVRSVTVLHALCSSSMLNFVRLSKRLASSLVTRE